MIGKILLAVDGSECNKAAVDYAINFARDCGATLTACCVFDLGVYAGGGQVPQDTDSSKFIQGSFDKALEYVTAKTAEVGMNLSVVKVCGRPAPSVVEAGKDFDLIICGTLGRTGVRRMLVGSVAEEIVRTSYCPVLVVRSPSN